MGEKLSVLGRASAVILFVLPTHVPTFQHSRHSISQSSWLIHEALAMDVASFLSIYYWFVHEPWQQYHINLAYLVVIYQVQTFSFRTARTSSLEMWRGWFTARVGAPSMVLCEGSSASSPALKHYDETKGVHAGNTGKNEVPYDAEIRTKLCQIDRYFLWKHYSFVHSNFFTRFSLSCILR